MLLLILASHFFTSQVFLFSIIFTLLTIHYIDDMWNLQSYVLDIAEMSMDHTAINVTDELQENLCV